MEVKATVMQGACKRQCLHLVTFTNQGRSGRSLVGILVTALTGRSRARSLLANPFRKQRMKQSSIWHSLLDPNYRGRALLVLGIVGSTFAFFVPIDSIVNWKGARTEGPSQSNRVDSGIAESLMDEPEINSRLEEPSAVSSSSKHNSVLNDAKADKNQPRRESQNPVQEVKTSPPSETGPEIEKIPEPDARTTVFENSHTQDFVALLSNRATEIVNTLEEINPEDASRFAALHERHTSHLVAREYIAAHETLREIYTLLNNNELFSTPPVAVYCRRPANRNGVFKSNGAGACSRDDEKSRAFGIHERMVIAYCIEAVLPNESFAELLLLSEIDRDAAEFLCKDNTQLFR